MNKLARLCAAVGIVAVGALVSAGSANASTDQATQAAAVSDTLLPGQKLMATQYIRSKNGQYTLQMSRYGDVTLTRRGYTVQFWNSGTTKPGSVLVMGKNGSLEVIYGRTRIWSIGAYSPGAKLVLPDTGNLAIYNTRGKAVWNRHMVIGTLMPGSKIRPVDTYGRDVTMYSVNRVYTLQMRTDGNLVLLRNGTTVLWSSNTAGHPESTAWISQGGRFGVLNKNGEETYVFDTRRPGSVAQVRDDGHLLLIYGRTVVKVLH